MITRRVRSRASVLFAVALAVAAPAGAVPGDLDAAFGDGGRARVTFPGETSPRDMVVLPDGRIVVGATLNHDVLGAFTIVLARFDAQGVLDPAFGDGGTTTTELPGDPTGIQLKELVVLADGRLLVAGIVFPQGSLAAALARYDRDGRLDETFGQAGFRSVPGGVLAGMVVDDVAVMTVAHQPTNAGQRRTVSVLAGTGDVSRIVDREPELRARAAARSDGRIVFVEMGPRMVVTRLETPDLGNDRTFGAQGEAVVPADVALTEATTIVPLPDGRLVVAGRFETLNDSRPALVRLLPDGVADASFGTGGRVVLQEGATFGNLADVVSLADGRLIVGGTACASPSNCSGFLACLNEDGGLDSSFGRGGLVEGLPKVNALALPDAEHLLAVGQEDQQMVLTRHLLSTCGNGVIEAGETCDDGNLEDGDCCAADCRTEPDGAPCASDDSVCTADACRAGSCTHETPDEVGCTTAGSATLVLVDGADANRNRVRLVWSGITTTPQPLGDPTRTTDVSLCVIDGPPEARRVVAELTAPGGVACGTSPCWRPIDGGFRYRDRRRTRDGIGALALSIDGADARVVVRAKGPNVDLQPLTGERLLVRVLQSDAPGCFESTVVVDDSTAARVRATVR